MVFLQNTSFLDVFNRAGRAAEKEAAKDPQRPPLLREECCFSIIYSDNKSLDLVGGDEKVAAAWVRGLKSLIAIISSTLNRKSDVK